jgi:hypothetical protein
MLVRPVVTLSFVGTICYLALDGNKEMLMAVSTLGGVAVNAWFADRSNKPAVLGEK